jgi:hypothetical protein
MCLGTINLGSKTYIYHSRINDTKNSDNYLLLETEQNNEITFTRNPGRNVEGRQIRQTDLIFKRIFN